ncbi:hypothetical protein INT43_004247 [Umbelopsis isabellina]|uniref:Mitochondrial import inner membrane translocase subunit TIM54 n=1 Tax=Mortierella isabellina TaxID=91625 RepID=A0A8H7PJ45_MORIS|nr:hypothetical protein INT43_004247 [Umbelopsis isabellina]
MTARRLPFGIKAPSRGTLIFGSIVAGISGVVYASNHYKTQARQNLFDKVTFLADRPLGVHEMPRKVTIYLAPPPGDSLEKSRVWFREYVKPVLYKAAVDYEVREGRNTGDIESMICEEIRQKRKAAKEGIEPIPQVVGKPGNPFSPVPVKHNESDAILAIGRIAWGEVLNGLAKGCEAPLKDKDAVETNNSTVNNGEQTSTESDNQITAIEGSEQLIDQKPVEVSFEEESGNEEKNISKAGEQPILVSTSSEFSADGDNNSVALIDDEEPSFSLPPTFPAVMYIPHENVIGWSNVPYRLYMWAADYKRVDWIGEYAVAVALNQRQPLKENDIDVGHSEKRYWVGDEAKEKVANDKPITLEDKVREHLSTFVRSEN